MKYAVKSPSNAGERYYGPFDDVGVAVEYAENNGGAIILLRETQESKLRTVQEVDGGDHFGG